MDILNRAADLASVVNPELAVKGDWMGVPEDLAQETVFNFSQYYKSTIDNRSHYDPMTELFLDGGRLLMPVLRAEEMNKLEVKAFTDDEGNVVEMRVNLKDSNEFLSIKGKALEDNARFYFHEKEKKEK